MTLGAGLLVVGAAHAAHTERVSVSSTGEEGNGNSDNRNDPAAVSADGRFVAFRSTASNLVAHDRHEGNDNVFLRDRRRQKTTLASRTAQGRPGNGLSYGAAISANGRYVAFASGSSNLVRRDTNHHFDIFVFDRKTKDVRRVSLNSRGHAADRDSAEASISAKGRYVAFQSKATNLTPRAGANGNIPDVFVRDLKTRRTELVSQSPFGEPGEDWSSHPHISAHGRFVAFQSKAENLGPGGGGVYDVFLRNRKTGTTELVSHALGGGPSNDYSDVGGISADGRFVTFSSEAFNLVQDDANGRTSDVFVWDRETEENELVSVNSNGEQGKRDSFASSISADGRSVLFSSNAHNLVPRDLNGRTDTFVRDRDAGKTKLVSVGRHRRQANLAAPGDAISGDGRIAVFHSRSPILVRHDNNNRWDVFARSPLR